MVHKLNFFILLNKEEGLEINFDILETNLINIIILIILLIYVLGDFLKENLSFRQKQIIINIQDGEKRLNEANLRLTETKSQWTQAQIIIKEIKSLTKRSKINVVSSGFSQINRDLSQRYNNILMILRYRELQVFNNVMKEVSKLALRQVGLKLQTELSKKDQDLIIDKKINSLGSQL